jgi:beta-aspartyl-peptidase (threonine type)
MEKTYLQVLLLRVKNVRNPIELAYTLMKKSEHVFLIGNGAEEFAKQNGIAI